MPRRAAPLAGSSIRVVARRTGLAAPTLRVWERRYGFPKPVRRSGGSRVYTEDDVSRLQLLARAIEAGFRPGEVVPLSVAEVSRLVDAATADAPALPVPVALPTPVGKPTALAIIEALAGDNLALVRTLLRTAAVTLGPRSFVSEVAHPLVVGVGEAWARGELEVRHEHLVSALLSTQLRLLLGAVDEGTGSPTVLLATLPGEPHTLGLEMVAVYLAASHGAPRILGADSPLDQIVSAAEALDVDAVGISIARGADKRAAQEHAKELRKKLPEAIELWIGGEGGASAVQAKHGLRVVRTFAELDAAASDFRADAQR